jgi:SAM-dependent methyltransferase
VPGQTESYEALTQKTTAVWRRIPEETGYGVILDVGCGYGRIALHLSLGRRVACDYYVGVDVSETMLRHFLRYRRTFNALSRTNVIPIATSADALPLHDDSTDLVVSSAVFLHMGARYLQKTLSEIARVLKPGGGFVFESSFPNRRCPANLPSVLLQWLGERRPNQMKLYTLAEVRGLLEASGLVDKAGGYRIEPNAHALLPKRLGPISVPFARAINSRLPPPNGRARQLLAVSFTATSAGLANAGFS